MKHLRGRRRRRVLRLAGRREVCKGLLSTGVGVAACESTTTAAPSPSTEPIETVELPAARTDGALALEAALQGRQSIRSFTDERVELADLGQLLWAAQGVNREDADRRTSPSAGATYPLELYALTRDGVHHYVPDGHRLEVLSRDDVRELLPSQEFVHAAPVVVIVTAVFGRTEERYGDRGERFVHLEAGHAAHGLLLQAVALGLGATPVGSFDDAELQAVIGAPADHEPLYVIPVGYPG